MTTRLRHPVRAEIAAARAGFHLIALVWGAFAWMGDVTARRNAPPAAPARPWGDAAAAGFEKRLVDWLHYKAGLKVAPGATYPPIWDVACDAGAPTFVVLGRAANALSVDASQTESEWTLLVEDDGPCALLSLLEPHFTAVDRPRTAIAPGRVRVQFRSDELVPGSPLSGISFVSG